MKSFSLIVFILWCASIGIEAARCKFCEVGSTSSWAVSKDKRSAVLVKTNESSGLRTCQIFNTKSNKKFCVKIEQAALSPQVSLMFGIVSAAILKNSNLVDLDAPLQCFIVEGVSVCLTRNEAKLLVNRPRFAEGDEVCVWVKKGQLIWIKNGVRMNKPQALSLPMNKRYIGFFDAEVPNTRLKCVEG